MASPEFQNLGVEVNGEEIHELLNELDANHNGQVEVEEYLQVSTPQQLQPLLPILFDSVGSLPS